MPEQPQNFANLDELYTVAEDLPEAYRADIHAHDPQTDEWSKLPYRDSIWLDDQPRAVGDVSANDDWYNIIQYGEILETVADSISQYETEIQGRATLSPSGHMMTAAIEFEDAAVEPVEGDTILLGLHIQAGHSGFHALKYDVGAERMICSNGMTAFIDALHYEQTHSQPFQPGLSHQAVDSVMQGTETVENRLREARDYEFFNTDEAVLTLLDHNIDWYLDTDGPEEAAGILRESLHEEMGGRDRPTLYDTYNAATRAITHRSDEPEYRRVQGLEQAAQLLETGNNQLPDIQDVAQQAIERRLHTLREEDGQCLWEDEDENLRELADARGLAS